MTVGSIVTSIGGASKSWHLNGRNLLLANPDMVERFRRGAPLNPPDYATFYAGEAKGYTDYPFLQD